MNRKIDIFLKQPSKYGYEAKPFWIYECSTNSSKTCKEAKRNFCIKYALDSTQVKANFSTKQ